MEIHQLRYFIAVAEEGSFSRAAAKVRVAQPSLSQQIQKLEAEFGQPLFDRLPRSVVLTDAGTCLIDYARNILPKLIEGFQRRYPKVKLEIVEDVTEGIARRVEAGELDIALLSTCRQSPTLKREPLLKEPLLALVSKKNPLAKKSEVTWDDLKSQRFLVLHEMHNFRYAVVKNDSIS